MIDKVGVSVTPQSAFRWLLLALAALAMMIASAAMVQANQVPTSSSGAGPVVKTYPGTLTYTASVTGAPTTIFAASTPLNSLGGVTSAQLSPAIAATTNGTEIDVGANGCVNTTSPCTGRGTLTILFNKAVTNPVLHLSGLGGNTGTTASMYHAQLVLSSWVASGTPTLTRLNGNTPFVVTGGNTIGTNAVNGGTSCVAATAAACGSVQITGTVTSVTFNINLQMGGSGANPAAGAVEGFNFTVSTDEDFGDAPASYQASPVASHIIGGLYLGASVTADNVAVTNSGALAASPIASATASTDGGDDGVTFPTLIRGIATNIDVAVTGTGGQLQGWVDWAGDGSFATAGDQVATNAIDGGAGDADGVANGVIRLAVTPPAGATQTTAKARFRISTTASLGINGNAPDGEVEDYEVIVYPQRADLSLTKTVSDPTPTNGGTVSFTLTATSAVSTTSTVAATGITVQDTLPAGFSFTSATGTGTYNSGTGVWSVGSLAPGASAAITITGTVTATSGTVTNIAQISASSVPDPDSTVNNGVTTEDDYATAAFSVASAMAAPVCAVGITNQIITNGTFASGTGPSWTGWTAGAVWLGTGTAAVNNDTTAGTLTQNGLTGLNFGPSATGGSVIQLSQWWRNGGPAASSTTAQLTVSVAGTDYARIDTPAGAGTSATITYLNGASGNLSTITEFATTGWRINIPTTVAATGAISFNFVPSGTAPSDDFEIDNVTLYTCQPGVLTVAKTSSVIVDGVSVTNPKAIPGATIQYCILVTNTGPVPTSNVSANDALPTSVTYVPASMKTGTSCAGATTVEDDDASGADESDPYGTSISGTTVTGTAANLAVGASFAFTINTTVN